MSTVTVQKKYLTGAGCARRSGRTISLAVSATTSRRLKRALPHHGKSLDSRARKLTKRKPSLGTIAIRVVTSPEHVQGVAVEPFSGAVPRPVVGDHSDRS